MEPADRHFAAQIARINDEVMTPLYKEYQVSLRQGHAGMSELAAREANWALIQKFVGLLGIRAREEGRRYPDESSNGVLLAADPYGVRALQASVVWAQRSGAESGPAVSCYQARPHYPFLIVGDRAQGRWSREILAVPLLPRVAAEGERLLTLRVPAAEGLELLRDWPARIQSRALLPEEAHRLYDVDERRLGIASRTPGSVVAWKAFVLRGGKGRILAGRTLRIEERRIERVGPSDDDLESFEITKQMGALAARFGKSKALERLFRPTPADEPTSQRGRVPWRRRVREAVASGLRAST